MRTVKFFFDMLADAEVIRTAVDEIIGSMGARGVEFFPLRDSSKAVRGIALKGEYELVAMASQRVRKYLKGRGLYHREEDESAHAADEPLLPPVTLPQPGHETEEESEAEEELADRPGYGDYPQLPGASPRSRGKRRPQPAAEDADLQKAREKLLRDDEFGFSRLRGKLTAAERQSLTFERALKSGVAFYRLGLYEDAERRLLEAAKNHKGHAETQHYLGLVNDQVGHYEAAEKHFRQAIRLDPGTGATHFYLGNVYQKQGKFDHAIAEYKLAIELDPEVPIVYNNLAWVFYQADDHERAIRAFEETIAMEPDLPFPHNGLACVYLELGAFADAVSAFRRALELYPEYAAAHLKLGWCLLQMGDIPQAIEEFKAVLDTSEDPEYTLSANYSLGHSYLAQGQLLEAREAFHRVVAEQDVEFADAILHLGVIQLRLGFAEEAIGLLKHYARMVGDEATADVYKYLAQGYFQVERFRPATEACNRALEKAPQDAEIYELLGQIAGSTERWNAALKHLKRAVELAPDLASAYFHLGWVQENRHDVPAAIEAYKNAIQRNPESSEAYSSLGWLYLEQGKREEALVIFEKALELNPRDTALLNNLGWLYSTQGKYDEALQYYQRALQVEPDSSMLRCNVGTLYLHMNRREDAEREWKRALKLNNDAQASANAHYYLGLLVSTSDVKQAVDHYNKALELDAELAAAYFRLAECWLQQPGSPSAARKALEKYLELEPEGEFAAQARQYLAERLGSSKGTKKKSPNAAIQEAGKKRRASTVSASKRSSTRDSRPTVRRAQ